MNKWTIYGKVMGRPFRVSREEGTYRLKVLCKQAYRDGSNFKTPLETLRIFLTPQIAEPVVRLLADSPYLLLEGHFRSTSSGGAQLWADSWTPIRGYRAGKRRHDKQTQENAQRMHEAVEPLHELTDGWGEIEEV